MIARPLLILVFGWTLAGPVVMGLLLFVGLAPPATAAVEVLTAPNLGLMQGAGRVQAMARQSDGKIIIGGQFNLVNGIPRKNIARLNADGTLDTTWYPAGGADSDVNALAVDGNNNVYVGGYFTTLGGQSRNRLARVTSAGAVDSWYPAGGADNGVIALAVDGNNNVYVGGGFTTLGGQGRNGIARVTSAGAVDSWYPAGGADSSGVAALVVDGNNNVYVGGYFTTLGGQSRNRLARVTSAGAVDSWYPAGGADNDVRALAVDGNNVYVGGGFASFGGQVHLSVAQVSGTTGDPTNQWAHASAGSGFVSALTRDSTGRMLLGGRFDVAAGIGRKNLLRLNADGTLDTTWYPAGGANGDVNALAVDGNNNVYVGGGFATLGGQSRNRLARVTSAGAVDSWYPAGGAIHSQAASTVNALAVDGNNNVYVGGVFTTLGGQSRNGIARVASAGTVDNWYPVNGATYYYCSSYHPYNCYDSSSYVYSLAVDNSNNIYVGGAFNRFGGQSRNRLARATSAGAVDSWYPVGGADPGAYTPGPVTALAVDGNNNVYVGGGFTTLGGQGRNRLARVTSAGAVDSWYPAGGADGSVSALAVDGNNNVYVGGWFTTLGGQGRNRLARVTSAGTVDTWYPAGGADGSVSALAVDGNNVYVGGGFTTLGGQIRITLAALATSRLTVVSVNGGAPPLVQTPFDVTLDLRDSTNQAVPVTTATPVQLTVQTGAGMLGGTTSCTISVGASGCTVTGVTYSLVETGVVLCVAATGGDATEPGDSAAFDVVKATPTINLTRNPNDDTTIGQTVIFTAIVAVTPPTSGTPDGTVTFNDGATVLCANVTLSSGSAACTTSALSLGSHSLTAVYSGDANFTGGTSAPLTHNVNQAPAITSAATTTFTVGQSDSFTVTATGTPAPTISYSGTLPSGVSFTSGTFSGTPAAGTEKAYPLILTASNSVNPTATQSFTLTVQGTDNDGDGYRTPDDCNDNDLAIYPGAPELCDRQDNDCDPVTPETCTLGCPQR